jgi:hypothetical protein
MNLLSVSCHCLCFSFSLMNRLIHLIKISKPIWTQNKCHWLHNNKNKQTKNKVRDYSQWKELGKSFYTDIKRFYIHWNMRISRMYVETKYLCIIIDFDIFMYNYISIWIFIHMNLELCALYIPYVYLYIRTWLKESHHSGLKSNCTSCLWLFGQIMCYFLEPYFPPLWNGE